jgi:hypothetical protein
MGVYKGYPIFRTPDPRKRWVFRGPGRCLQRKTSLSVGIGVGDRDRLGDVEAPMLPIGEPVYSK